MRLLVSIALLLACATTADARTFLFGAVTLGPDEIARLHVVNAEGGDVTVILVFKGTTPPAILATTGAVLAPGDVKILDIKGSDVPGGIVVPSVVARAAKPSSALCSPLVTLQVIDRFPRQPRDAGPFASVQVAARGLGNGERAAVDMLRTLAKAQSLFFDATRGGNPAQTPHYAASLGELAQAGLVPPNTAVSGYELGFGVGLYTFQITAKPVAGPNGHADARTFYVDEAGVLSSGGSGAPCDDPLPPTTPPIGG